MFAVKIEKLERSAANAIQPFYVEYLARQLFSEIRSNQPSMNFVRPIGTKGSVGDALYRENRFAKRLRWTHFAPKSCAATNESCFGQPRGPHRLI